MEDDQNSGSRLQDPSDIVSAAWQQLNLVLGFFSRIDTKLSVVLGINLGMLALLATRSPKLTELTPLEAGLGVALVIALCFSFRHLWTGSFPHLDGGTSSLVYFRGIAGMRESDFKRAYSTLTLQQLADGLLEQCWCNSKILTCKFHSLRHAYFSTLVAVVPWTCLVVILPSPR